MLRQTDDYATDVEEPDPFAPATASRIRRMVLESLHSSGGGHFGSCASSVDLLLALCGSRPMACCGGKGDRLLLSKGHASMALYAVLSLLGPKRLPLDRFASFGSPLQGHPDRQHLPALDFSFGSLGQGVAVGIGMALSVQRFGEHVWVVLGDGECQEGMVWESAMLAARYRLSNLHVIVDANGEQECGWGHESSFDQRPVPDDVAKWRAFGWQTTERDGHDSSLLSQWIHEAAMPGATGPSVLLARTRKSLSHSEFASRFRRHHASLSSSEFERLSEELAQGDSSSTSKRNQ